MFAFHLLVILCQPEVSPPGPVKQGPQLLPRAIKCCKDCGNVQVPALLSSHWVLSVQVPRQPSPESTVMAWLSCRIVQILGGHTGVQAIREMTPTASLGRGRCLRSRSQMLFLLQPLDSLELVFV